MTWKHNVAFILDVVMWFLIVYIILYIRLHFAEFYEQNTLDYCKALVMKEAVGLIK